jgi:hypothetical protein
MEWWKRLTCLARLEEPPVLPCAILGGTLSLLGLCLPFNNWLASERSKERKKEKNMNMRGLTWRDEPIQVVLRPTCLGELRPFGASMLFARRSNASSCALALDDRGADGGYRSRGALWALHPCVFVRLWR